MRRYNLLLDEPIKGEIEKKMSITSILNKIENISKNCEKRINNLKKGTFLYNEFSQLRTIIASNYNTNNMIDIRNKIIDLFKDSYDNIGVVIPFTIKAYLIGNIAKISGDIDRKYLPISINSIPIIENGAEVIDKNIYMYNNSSLERIINVTSNEAYIFTEIKKDNPTINDFDGFDKSDIEKLKNDGINVIYHWAYKNGTIYNKLNYINISPEGEKGLKSDINIDIDNLKIKSNTDTMIIIGVAIFLIVIIILLLLFSGKVTSGEVSVIKSAK